MATFEETVLALNPLLFWRCKDLPGSGDQITDYSGNDFHGDVVSGSVILGAQGLVETDSLSRSVHIPGGFANNIAQLDPTPSELLFTGNFSIGCFASHELSSGTQYLFARGGVANATAQGIHLKTGGSDTRLLSAHFRTWDGADSHLVAVTSEIEHLINTVYFFVLTRNSSTARLYLNDRLVGETTGADINPLLVDSGHDIVFGAAGNNLAPLKGLGAELMIFDYALTAGQVAEIFESSRLSLPVSATITVRVQVELDTDQVDPIDFPFTHNFGEPLSGSPRPITEHLSYATNVLQSEPDYQQRINAQPHHVERTLEYFVTPTSARARAMMQAALWAPGQTYKLPIAKDWGVLTAQSGSGANTLSLDTTLRDYEIGSHVVVWENVYQPGTAQFFEITSRTDTELGISPVVGSTLPIGSTVMPARLAILPDDDLSIESHLIDRETAALQFEILSTELSTRRLSTYTPTETYLSIEVFDLERVKVEWLDSTEYQISRRKQGTGNPTGNDYQRAIDTGSPQTIPLRVLLTTRAAQAEFYGWLDARQGKINPVWIRSEENDLHVIARDGGFIVINYIGYTELYNVHSARRHIAFKKTDGSVVYKMITAAVNNGNGTETLSVSNPPLLADIVKTSFLRLCTAPDQFELVHHRDGQGFITQCQFVMMELLATPEPA